MRESRLLNKISKLNCFYSLILLNRVNKLKSIKEKAEEDLKDFRKAQAAKYDESVRKMQQEMAQDSSSAAAQKKQAEEIRQIDSDFQNNKDEVIKMLISNVMNVNIEIPKVIKGDFESSMNQDK